MTRRVLTACGTLFCRAALVISPTSETVASGFGHTFSAIGRVGGNSFSIFTNNSGGTIDSTDNDGSTADATLTVVAALVISPTSDTVPGGMC